MTEPIFRQRPKCQVPHPTNPDARCSFTRGHPRLVRLGGDWCDHADTERNLEWDICDMPQPSVPPRGEEPVSPAQQLENFATAGRRMGELMAQHILRRAALWQGVVMGMRTALDTGNQAGTPPTSEEVSETAGHSPIAEAFALQTAPRALFLDRDQTIWVEVAPSTLRIAHQREAAVRGRAWVDRHFGPLVEYVQKGDES